MFRFILVLFFFLLLSNNFFAFPQADLVVVKKSELKLYLIKDKKILGVYSISLGSYPKGHKLREGDGRTPEGRYILDYKNAHSKFYKSIHISYPNKLDILRARKLHLSPGGNIMIHGQKNGWGWASFFMQHFNWTNGCIALSNSDMDKIWKAIRIGTPIDIKP